MHKLIIINDGDIYGYIFCLFLLKKNLDINITFLKIKNNEKVNKINCLTHTSVQYFKKYDIHKFITNIDGSFNLNRKFINFFDTQDTFYLTHENEKIDSNILPILSSNKKIAKELLLNLYDTAIYSELNIKDKELKMNDPLMGLNFNEDLFKEYIIKESLKFSNFKLIVESDIDYIKTNMFDYYVDNTHDNLLSNNEFITSEDDIIPNFVCTSQSYDFKNKDVEIIPNILYSCNENSITETITSYTKKYEKMYEFKGDDNNKINNIFYKNKIFNIGTSFLKFDFSFNYDQILHFDVIDKVMDIIEDGDFRESKLFEINKNFHNIYKNIKNYIGHLFLYSKRNDSSFWNTFNTKDYYINVEKYKEYDNLIFNTNNIISYIKSIYFNNEIYTPEQNNQHIIYNLLVNQNEKNAEHLRFGINYYRYLKKYLYKEYEKPSLLR